MLGPGQEIRAFVAPGDLGVNRWDVITPALERAIRREIRVDPRFGDEFVQFLFPSQSIDQNLAIRDQLGPGLRKRVLGLTEVTAKTIEQPTPVAPRDQKMLGEKPVLDGVVGTERSSCPDLGVPRPARTTSSSGRRRDGAGKHAAISAHF